MKKLTAIILSVCLGAAGLTGCQAGASETPAASSRAADTSRQQAEKGPKEETKSREDSAGEPDASISVSENGYLFTNLYQSGKLFYIGEENAAAVMQYLLDSSQGKV